MVKLTGPGLANEASGSLAGQLTFSNWKGKAYLKKHTKPKQPRTPRQLSMRHTMTFLSQEWNAIPPVYHATWDDLARASNISPFNAYQKVNLQRWRNFQAPSILSPVTETGPIPTWVDWGSIDHGSYATLFIDITNARDGWGLGFLVKPAWPQPEEWFWLLNLQHLYPNTRHTFDFRPKTSGLWCFSAISFTNDGKFQPPTPRLFACLTLTV